MDALVTLTAPLGTGPHSRRLSGPRLTVLAPPVVKRGGLHAALGLRRLTLQSGGVKPLREDLLPLCQAKHQQPSAASASCPPACFLVSCLLLLLLLLAVAAAGYRCCRYRPCTVLQACRRPVCRGRALRGASLTGSTRPQAPGVCSRLCRASNWPAMHRTAGQQQRRYQQSLLLLLPPPPPQFGLHTCKPAGCHNQGSHIRQDTRSVELSQPAAQHLQHSL